MIELCPCRFGGVKEGFTMARNRDYDDGDFDQPRRSSPYQDMDADDYEDDYADDYEDDDEYASSSVKKGARKGGGNTSGTVKLLGGVIVLLVVILIALVIIRAVITNKQNQLDNVQPSASVDTIPEQTPNPAPIVFGPVSDATSEPEANADGSDSYDNNTVDDDWSTGLDDTGFNDVSPDDTAQDDTANGGTTPEDSAYSEAGDLNIETPAPVIATAEPTATPGATDTPLPIILTNTPTPTPEPTATPTPSPSPTPSPTPEPTPTPVAEIGTGTVNRDAKLRADAVANAKVKKTIKKGETVTIHEAKTDSTGKLWYYLTVDDSRDEGWMRDYVVTTTTKISASATNDTAADSAETQTETAASTETSDSNEVIATAKTNRAANLRQTMGGKVLVQLKKGTKVNIYEQLTDSKGNVWYKAQAQNGTKVGYLRDYVVTLDSGASVSSTGTSASTTAAAENLQDREVIGKATTNRAANVREEPLANAKVVRQLGNGMELQILAKYAGVKEETWYEVVTASGKTYGFVRDYVVYVTKLDKNAPTLTYEK